MTATRTRRPPRRWRRFTISNDELRFEPGELHSDEDCDALWETDDGCPACIEEMDEASSALMQRLARDGLETWDCWYVSKPGLGLADDRFWTFDLLVSRAAA